MSFLKSKYNLKDTIDKINNTDAEYIHVDVMDGNFVPNISCIYNDVKDVLKNTNKMLDIHLMVDNPIKYILEYKNLSPKFITIHSEINNNIDDLVDLIKSYGIGVGLSIKPKTSIEFIEKYLDRVDNVLIMSVEPGKGGQKFMDSVVYKIDILDKIRKNKKLNYKISIDGGINKDNIKMLYDAGVSLAVMGTSFFREDDKESFVNKILEIIDESNYSNS